MARVLFFGLLAMCLVCLIQAAPNGEQPSAVQPSAFDALVEAAKHGMETLKATANSIANNPEVQKGVRDMAAIIVRGAEAVRENAQAIADDATAVPKTE